MNVRWDISGFCWRGQFLEDHGRPPRVPGPHPRHASFASSLKQLPSSPQIRTLASKGWNPLAETHRAQTKEHTLHC